MKKLLAKAKRLWELCNQHFASSELLPVEKLMAIPQAEFDALENAYVRTLETLRRFAGKPTETNPVPPIATSVTDRHIAKIIAACDKSIECLSKGSPENYTSAELNALIGTYEHLLHVGRQLATARRELEAA